MNARGDAAYTIAVKYLSLERCVIPSGGGPDGKAALVPWKPYQTSKPTEETIQKWEKELKPSVWAMPTGPVSGCFVVDADTPEAVARMEAVGLRPHVKTRKGAHYYCRLPSWVVSNSTKIVPGFDIRGQGGYVNFCGSNGKAHYDVMTMPTDASLYGIEQLPEDLQKALRPKPSMLSERILQQAIDQAHDGNRNDTGLWLACQLRDNGLSETEAESFLQRYAAGVKNNGAEPYDEAEAIASLHQAFTKPAREPWHKIPTVKESKRFNLTDLGNAERLVSQYSDILHYCYERRRWLVWNGKVWEWDSGNKVTTLAKHTVRNIYREAGDEPEEKKRKEIAGHARNSESDHRINAIISLAESEPGIPVKITELDIDPWLLNCLNGTICIKKKAQETLDGIIYLSNLTAPDGWLRFIDYKGKQTRLLATSQRTVRSIGGSRNPYRYYLAPVFRPLLRKYGIPVLELQVRLYLTDMSGKALQPSITNRRRKRIARSWWNYQWISRVLAISQWLFDGQPIYNLVEGRNYEITVTGEPLSIMAPLGIDEHFLTIPEPVEELVETAEEEADDSEWDEDEA